METKLLITNSTSKKKIVYYSVATNHIIYYQLMMESFQINNVEIKDQETTP